MDRAGHYRSPDLLTNPLSKSWIRRRRCCWCCYYYYLDNAGLRLTIHSIKFHKDLISSFWVILLTNRQTDTGENIIFLAEIKMVTVRQGSKITTGPRKPRQTYGRYNNNNNYYYYYYYYFIFIFLAHQHKACRHYYYYYYYYLTNLVIWAGSIVASLLTIGFIDCVYTRQTDWLVVRQTWLWRYTGIAQHTTLTQSTQWTAQLFKKARSKPPKCTLRARNL